ncbi:AAA family ATPase [Burkholderia pseudomallei]|nr:AAA family ATPase [Burkholderia pseudomallei]QBP52331.1 AAA family ATPase [Burkholderia pseudomallei]QBP72253.1 AAA family ATPase [Burkholderia pseudomallei]QBR27778.1 AAA family ATPase [Burkholderia pseudomallei]
MVGVLAGVLDRLDTGFACHGRHCIAPGTAWPRLATRRVADPRRARRTLL